MATKNKKNSGEVAMTPQQAGHLGGSAPRSQGMSREEAGKKGGSAPHTCRGFACQKKNNE